VDDLAMRWVLQWDEVMDFNTRAVGIIINDDPTRARTQPSK
jgi:hypothetical protein